MQRIIQRLCRLDCTVRVLHGMQQGQRLLYRMEILITVDGVIIVRLFVYGMYSVPS